MYVSRAKEQKGEGIQSQSPPCVEHQGLFYRALSLLTIFSPSPLYFPTCIGDWKALLILGVSWLVYMAIVRPRYIYAATVMATPIISAEHQKLEPDTKHKLELYSAI